MIIFLNDTAKHLQTNLNRRPLRTGKYKIGHYADGAPWYRLETDIKRQNVAVVASLTQDVACLIDLLALHRLCKEGKAGDRILLIPYFGFARQDRFTRYGECPLGLLMAEMIRNTNPSRVITIDIHSPKVLAALGAKAKDVSALPLFAKELHKKDIEVLVAPDRGAVPRIQALNKLMGGKLKIATIHKTRPRADVARAEVIKGNVKDKRVAVIDDMITTGGTIVEAVKLLNKRGANSITVCATHGVFTKNARDRLAKLKLDEIIVTNTLPQTRQAGFKILNIAPLIKQALQP
ncbi:MAG: ribose-phosphate diphosphokinase [Candidatus Uhrbacteria bacterium]|nr:ribose-phosphate diphosphokinase [Patescibacteria group bacterium]MBU1906705.1 ribose-phosphate diphosphokinase [Patescibacteria group bacterium]